MELELKGIKKSFGSKEVLKGLGFKTQSGQAFGLLGRNGAGKTTTIRILMDVFKADEGEILLDGAPVNYESLIFGYLPEERGLYPKEKVRSQLIYFGLLKGREKKEVEESVDYWLDRMEMSQHKNDRLETLSKGNAQKIQFIAALAGNPDVVILDEPFSGLDPVNAEIFKDAVRELINKGKLVLFSSHQMNYVEEFCDHLAILNNGKIVLNGELSEIKRSYPRDRLVISSEQSDKILQAYPDKTQRLSKESLLFRLDNPAQKREVMQTLVESYPIDSISVFEPSLEDIFVEYTKEASA